MENLPHRDDTALSERYPRTVPDDQDHDLYQQMLLDLRRRLVLQNASTIGVRAAGRRSQKTYDQLTWLHDKFSSSLHPCLALDPGAGLRILGINEAFAYATMTSPAVVKGQPLFEVFPDNPDHRAADGMFKLYESLIKAVASGHAHAMPVQRYDMRDMCGTFVERHWLMVNIPMFDYRDLICLLHRVADVTNCVARGYATHGPPPPVRTALPTENDHYQFSRH